MPPPYEQSVIDHRQRDWNELVLKRGLRYKQCRFDNYESKVGAQSDAVEKLKAFCVELVENTAQGKGVMLFGPKGTGKDHLMMAAAWNAVARYLKVEWVNGADMRGDVRDSTKSDDTEREYAAKLARPQILWMSDPLPVTGPLTDAQQDRLFRILDARYSNLKPTWVTLNVSGKDELEQRIGPQSADRLRDGAIALFCNWPSFRETMK